MISECASEVVYGLVVSALLCKTFSAGTNTWRFTNFFDFLNENRKDRRLHINIIAIIILI